MLRAVIFDFDGVITDTEALHLRAFNQVLAEHSVEITQKQYYDDYLGLTDLDCFKLLIRQGRLGLDCQAIGNLVNEKNRIFEELAKTEAVIIEGVDDFLQMLKQNDVAMAICSGALLPEIELILDQSRLRPFFSVIVSADQIQRGKPHPEGFLLALQKLNDTVISPQACPRPRSGAGIQTPISPSECIIIEDSPWGLQAAKAAGMHNIAVTNSYDADQLQLAERIVTRLDALSLNDLEELCA